MCTTIVAPRAQASGQCLFPLAGRRSSIYLYIYIHVLSPTFYFVFFLRKNLSRNHSPVTRNDKTTRDSYWREGPGLFLCFSLRLSSLSVCFSVLVSSSHDRGGLTAEGKSTGKVSSSSFVAPGVHVSLVRRCVRASSSIYVGNTDARRLLSYEPWKLAIG